jgi:alkyl sulfatase BDS1-like metallo-beta-lactamase superfamily hydrolase
LARKFLRKVPLEEFMKAIAVRLDPKTADGKEYKLNIQFPEENTNFVLWLRNSVLHYRKNHRDETADASISVGHDFFIDLMLGEVGLTSLLLSEQLTIEGNRIVIIELLAMLDSGDDSFNIVTP